MRILIICIFFLSTDLFLNKLSSHELDYDPVEVCMDAFNGRNLLNAARACNQATHSTKKCMDTLIGKGKSVLLAARVCTPDFYVG